MPETNVTIRLRDLLSGGLKQVQRGVNSLKGDFEAASKAFDVAGQMSLAADSMQQLSEQARGLVEAPVRAAVEFEESMARLGGLTGQAGEQLQALKDRAKELGATTRFGPSQAAAGMQDLARAGLSSQEILKTIGPTLNLATAGGLNLARAADIATNVMAGLGLETSEANRTMDVLTKVGQSANTTVGQLGEAMKEAAPSARDAGVSLEETAAAAGILANAGRKGSQAGTDLRGALSKLTAQTPRAKEALDKLGVGIEDKEGNFRGFATVLSDLSKALQDVDQVERSELLKSLFGEEQRAGASILIRAAGSGELQQLTQQLQGSQGAAKDFAEEIKDTTAGGLKQFQSQMQDLKIAIGEQLLPVVNQLLEDLRPVIDDIRAWVSENPELVRTLGSAVIKFAAVTAVLAPVTRGLSALTTTFGLLRGAVAGPRGIIGAMRGMTSAAGGLSQPLSQLGTNATSASGKLNKATSALGKLGSVLGAAGIGVAIGSIVNQIGRLTDEKNRSISEEIADTLLGFTDSGALNKFGTEGENKAGRGGKVFADGTVVDKNGNIVKLGDPSKSSLAPDIVRQARSQGITGRGAINDFRERQEQRESKLNVEIRVGPDGTPRIAESESDSEFDLVDTVVDAGPTGATP